MVRKTISFRMLKAAGLLISWFLCVLFAGDAVSAIVVSHPAAADRQWIINTVDGPSCSMLGGEGLSQIAYRYRLPGFELAAEPVKRDRNRGPRAKAQDQPCDGTTQNPGTLPSGTGGSIVIKGVCNVNAGTYKYDNVNIVNGGVLNITDAKIIFWAKSILVENGGAVVAGSPDSPIGTKGGKLTINLWGADQGAHGTGIRCVQRNCGIPDTIWGTNKMDQRVMNPKTCNAKDLGNGVTDCFYNYDPLTYDDGGGNAPGYFGYKVLAVSFGGTLKMFGLKGATYPDNLPASSSGSSWVRLNNCPSRSNLSNANYTCKDGVLQPGAKQLIVSGPVKTWAAGDNIVLTTTDYLPDHSETLKVGSVSADGLTVTLDPATPTSNRHNASTYDLTSKLPPNAAQRGLTDLTAIDTRAAVALLTRSITIQSAGTKLLEPFPAAPNPAVCPAKDPNVYFGGHVIFRQGFKAVQIQGVEFYQLGQGGKIGHYPVHFHMDRATPPGTFVKDSSVWDSMTRWIVVHASQNVLLARNVGFLSIGHGYYIEDGTEIGNKLYSNIGISARAASCSPDNPRGVPGILAWTKVSQNPGDVPNYPPIYAGYVPYRSDIHQPTIFWIMNGWNDFQYNMAVGAQTCGFCYWWPPAIVSGPSQYEAWFGYASEQESGDHDGTTPLEKFYGNTCSTAMNAFNEVGNLGSCIGSGGSPTNDAYLPAVTNDLLNQFPPQTEAGKNYWPRISGGFRKATKCPAGDTTGDCSSVRICGDGDGSPNSPSANCDATVLDHFTSSFTWADQNFAAIWLRNQWNIVTDSAITDAQIGGLNFVTGGGYTRSDAIRGLFQLARKSVFVGNTQTAASDPFAENGGPFNTDSGLTCDDKKQESINYCLNAKAGMLMQLSNWGVGQRLLSIYDGPFFDDSNSFLDISPTTLTDCDLSSSTATNRCSKSASPYGRILGIRGINKGKGEAPAGCYLPNAAIGWKQPNGFYYPPAFHSENLYFKNVDIRHYVIEPLFTPNTLKTDNAATAAQFCNWNPAAWEGYTGIDRQTELTDDDGTLTGLNQTISVNEDNFFNAPSETVECASDVTANPAGTAKTSPYDYVTLAVYPDCATKALPPDRTCGPQGSWGRACTNAECYGVPLYRQFLNPDEYAAYQKDPTTQPNIRMAGQDNYQRSTMIPNHARYYMDTTVSQDTQLRTATPTGLNVFTGGQTYHMYFVYATPKTQETLQFYVGDKFDPSTLKLDQANISSDKLSFTTSALPSQWVKPTVSNGVLTINVNMNFPAFVTDYNGSFQSRCQPVDLCTWDSTSNTCGCNPNSRNYAACLGCDPTSPDYAKCVADPPNVPACYWATKDMDCPNGGCYGFEFTLPVPFNPPANAQPAPGCFPSDSNWAKQLAPVSQDLAGSCFYNAPPAIKDFCAATPQAIPDVLAGLM
jgi:hypothetical protein